MSSDPEGSFQLLQCLTGTELKVSGLRVGQLAEWQANKKMWCSQNKSTQNCHVISGHDILATRGAFLSWQSQGQWELAHGT